jgi:hypothetical protein
MTTSCLLHKAVRNSFVVWKLPADAGGPASTRPARGSRVPSVRTRSPFGLSRKTWRTAGQGSIHTPPPSRSRHGMRLQLPAEQHDLPRTEREFWTFLGSARGQHGETTVYASRNDKSHPHFEITMAKKNISLPRSVGPRRWAPGLGNDPAQTSSFLAEVGLWKKRTVPTIASVSSVALRSTKFALLAPRLQSPSMPLADGNLMKPVTRLAEGFLLRNGLDPGQVPFRWAAQQNGTSGVRARLHRGGSARDGIGWPTFLGVVLCDPASG